MGSNIKYSVKNTLPKSNTSIPKNSSNVAPFKQRNAVTMVEKFGLLEKDFQTMNVEFDQLKIDHEACKVKLAEAQKEISDWKNVTDALRAEVCALKKKFETVPVSMGKTSKETSIPSALNNADEISVLRAAYYKLPCKSKIEFEQLKEDLINFRLFAYMVSIQN